MTAIGFVGLGSMGAPVAGRLLQGNQVYGTNRTRAKAAPLIEQGLIWRDTPREVAAAAAGGVQHGHRRRRPGGDHVRARTGSWPACGRARIYVDMSTVSPQASRELAGRVHAAGATMIDAPVSGSVPAAENGTLSIMVGGPDEAFGTSSRCCARWAAPSPTWAATARACCSSWRSTSAWPRRCSRSARVCCWPSAAGSTRELAAHAMSESAIGSPMLKARAPLVLDLPEQAWFDVQLMHKDIRLALEAARESGIPLPAAAAADGVLSQAEELGYGHRDIAGLFQVLAAAAVRRPGRGRRPRSERIKYRAEGSVRSAMTSQAQQRGRPAAARAARAPRHPAGTAPRRLRRAAGHAARRRTRPSSPRPRNSCWPAACPRSAWTRSRSGPGSARPPSTAGGPPRKRWPSTRCTPSGPPSSRIRGIPARCAVTSSRCCAPGPGWSAAAPTPGSSPRCSPRCTPTRHSPPSTTGAWSSHAGSRPAPSSAGLSSAAKSPPAPISRWQLTCIYGPLWHRLLHGHAPLNDRFTQDVVEMALNGIQQASDRAPAQAGQPGRRPNGH